jgi:hypothetical protein
MRTYEMGSGVQRIDGVLGQEFPWVLSLPVAYPSQHFAQHTESRGGDWRIQTITSVSP